jgi:hypothetical protein
MQSHLLLLVLFAFFVSLVFGLLSREGLKEQLRFGALLLAAFIVAALVLGWLMYPFPL